MPQATQYHSCLLLQPAIKRPIAAVSSLLTSLFFTVIITLSPTSTLSAETTSTTGQPDWERETRLVNEIADSIIDGEVIYLNANDREVMAIDLEPDDEVKGAVILLHGRGYHSNWESVIYPLRTGLAEQGWRTLSVQMPVLDKQAKYYDYVPIFPHAHPRIDAAIDYLKEQGIDNIVLFAHSCGVHMSMDWLKKAGDSRIKAYIGAGMGATDAGQSMAEPFPLDTLKIPVLDVHGSDEFNAVLAGAEKRLAAIQKAGNAKSSQQVVPGANHYFDTEEQGDALLETVSEWLGTL